MACRWGWTSSGDSPDASQPSASNIPTTSHNPTSSFHNVRTQRFAPCQGRLYHQLLCSHRIRTDLVEDCGTNCVEPLGASSEAAFFCNDCFEDEAAKIWEDRKAHHNASWPAMEQMTSEQRDQWCIEHRQLEDEYAHDRKVYELELKAKTRPSNVCSTIEASRDEMEFATELDALSLSLMTSNEDEDNVQSQGRLRHSLPTDASEQLHWNLNTLALDRGSCSVEYSSSSAPTLSHGTPTRHVDEEELWRTPQNRN